jgi:hypothetical protein
VLGYEEKNLLLNLPAKFILNDINGRLLPVCRSMAGVRKVIGHA